MSAERCHPKCKCIDCLMSRGEPLPEWITSYTLTDDPSKATITAVRDGQVVYWQEYKPNAPDVELQWARFCHIWQSIAIISAG